SPFMLGGTHGHAFKDRVVAMRTIRSRCARAMAGFGVITVLGFLLMPVAAQAASGDGSQVGRTTAERSCPDDRCGAVQTACAGCGVSTLCWRDGGDDGNTNRWFRIRVNGVQGWVNLSYVSVKASVPYCSDLQVNEALFAGESIFSPGGTYQLIMQGDGNLVEY